MAMKVIRLLVLLCVFCSRMVYAENIYDSDRDRKIPIKISYPTDEAICTKHQRCSVVLLSAGYGIAHTKYSFLVNTFNKLGYMVIAVAHELTEDPPLSVSGNLYQTRSENWMRGADTLDFLKNILELRYQNYEFNNVLIVGHSNGGDISSWLGNAAKPYIKSIITLDHRRVQLPRSLNINTLSIRASDFEADKGVLPSQEESMKYNICVVDIPKAKHNDMSDYGPIWLKKRITSLITIYLSEGLCMLNKTTRE